MILSYSKKRSLFFCKPTFDERHVPKKAGFEFVADAKAWVTQSPFMAYSLHDCADAEVREILAPMHARYGMSWAAESTFCPPVPAGCELLPYQRAGVRFALDALNPDERRSPCRSVLIADPMGL